MKTIKLYVLAVLVTMFFSGTTIAQNDYNYLKERAEKNLAYLTKGIFAIKPVKIDNEKMQIYQYHTGNVPQFTLYWREVPKFIEMVENENSFDLVDLYVNKKNSSFINYTPPQNVNHYRDYPVDFKGLYVAIDPGHFGGDNLEAQLERRLVNIEGKEINQKTDVSFFEANLTYTTALLIKEELESLGATVMITRPYGAGAMGKSFNNWLRTDFATQLETSFLKGDISDVWYNDLKKAYKDSSVHDIKVKIFDFYKFLDFRARVDKINDFKPNITLIIHFNASEGSRPYGGDKRYSKPVKSNWSMAFVPGAFLNNELSKPEAAIDFMRLLISPDFDNSTRLSHLILKEHEKNLGVKPIPYDSLIDLKKVVNKTEYDGVFSRNLPLTRMVRGTVVYGESFLQDNIDMIKILKNYDLVVTDPKYGKIKTSSAVKIVKKSYIDGIANWLEENKSLSASAKTEKQ